MLYESSGVIPHGRLAIVDGAIKKADVISTAREKKLRPLTSASLRRTIQENEELKRRAIQESEELKRRSEYLQNKVDMHERLFLALFKEMGKELPEELRQGARSQPHGALIHLILEPKRLMTTPVMVIRVELLAVTTLNNQESET